MLIVHKRLVSLVVPIDLRHHDVLHHLGADACEGYGPVVFSGLAVSDKKGRYRGIYRGMYGLSETGFRQGFRRRKLNIVVSMLIKAL